MSFVRHRLGGPLSQRRFLALSCLVLCCMASSTFAQQKRGVTLYAAGDFRGASETFYDDVPRLDRSRVGNDHASSVRVDPGCTVTLYADIDYRGISTRLTSDLHDLRLSDVGNDRVSSLRVDCRPHRRIWTGDPRGATSDYNWGSRQGVALYAGGDFSGRREIFYGDDADLRNNRVGTNTTSSISLAPGCRVTLYSDPGFRGVSVDLENDVADMRRTRIGNDNVSSLRLDCRRYDGPDRPRGEGATLYAGGDYTGRAETFYHDVDDLGKTYIGNDTVSSVRVERGCEVELFAEGGFRGRSTVLTYDEPDLRRTEVGNDHVSSVRIDCRGHRGRRGRASDRYGDRDRDDRRYGEPRYGEPRYGDRDDRYDDRGPGYPGFGSREDGDGVTLYDDVDFRGRSATFYDNVRNLGRTPLGNDAASSIRVAPGCRVRLFRDANYRGTSTVIESDVSRLQFTPVGNNSVSSIEVDCR